MNARVCVDGVLMFMHLQMKWNEVNTKRNDGEEEEEVEKTLINVIASKSGTNDIFGVATAKSNSIEWIMRRCHFHS